MVSSYFHFVFVALIIFAVVDAQHIRKLHRSPKYRSPRLASSSRAVSISPDAHAPAREVPNGTFSDPRLFSSTSTTSTVLRRSTKIVNEHSSTTASIIRRSTLTPNNVKAGIAGGDAYPFLKDHIGWWYDWSPNPSKPGKPIAVPMLWGGGSVDAQDSQRLRAFQQLSTLATVPPYVLGFEEPDCPSGSGSAGMTVADGVQKWESLIAPMREKGASLGSPSMCKQADEDWLAEFRKQIKTDWDFTAVHINKHTLAGVQKDIEHFMRYGKPIWVTEFACVNDVNGFVPCTDQNDINNFINEIVPYMEENPNVYAYAYSNGLGLGNVWPLMNGNSLSESGKTYLNAIRRYH